MRVLLVSTNRWTSPYPVYPIGLDYVAGALAHEHEVLMLDLLSQTQQLSLPETIKTFEPDVVGISIRNIDNTDAHRPVGFIDDLKQIMREVRQATSRPVVLGGSGFSLFPDQLMTLLGADVGIVGEGERLNPLLRALEPGQSGNPIPGVIRPGQTILDCAPWEGLARRWPHPDVDRFRPYLDHGGMLNLQSKRGCPFRCTYCTYPLIEGRQLRRMEPRQVAQEARQLQELGASFLFFTDSVFNADIDHSLAVAAALNNTGLSIPWGAFFAPLPPPSGYYRSLAQAGCTHVEFGTESMSQIMLTCYQKSFSPEDVVLAHQAALDAQLHIAHYFLLGGPEENASSIDATLHQAERLHRAALFFFIGVRIYPHTPLWQKAVSVGMIGKEENLLPPVFYRPSGIALQEIRERVAGKATGRRNWVLDSGGEKMASTISRMHARGVKGPLWERLID